ncbi:MAG: sodium:solute symporter [Bacteroidaceae bacterium]|nr:sodium:solute symporter [Bacteroidaceae bacterium]
MTIFVIITLYFGLLLLVSRLTRGSGGNDAFFRGNRKSPWPLVAFGMIGASVSGVTFVSVPGMVLHSDMTYMQMVLGYIPGYAAVAFILLPIYYRLRLTSIYSYLGGRFGRVSYRTGASFFLFSKLTGAAVRLYLVCIVLHEFVLSAYEVPFVVTVCGVLALIWLYTRNSGIKTLVWTDTLQTACLLTTVVLILLAAVRVLGVGLGEALGMVWDHPASRIFEWGDWSSRQFFWKQFLSGIFIVIVMTGLDQDMMQKNLSCRDVRSAQKDMCLSGLLFTPVNLLVMVLGVLVVMIYEKTQTPLPAVADNLLPGIIASGRLGEAAVVFFIIGIIASAFSSADSAMTSISTSVCIDLLDLEADGRKGTFPGRCSAETVRRGVHVAVAAAFVLLILAVRMWDSSSIIDVIYTLASYTYGPLLGLYFVGIFTRIRPNDRWTPYIALLSPAVCWTMQYAALRGFGYQFGYELLMFNGALTALGLWASSFFVKK